MNELKKIFEFAWANLADVKVAHSVTSFNKSEPYTY